MRIYIRETVLKTDDDYKEFIKHKMMYELKEQINKLEWNDIVHKEERANSMVYTIDISI